jgi:ATP-dependent RNA helicase DDX24/MAK5
MALDSRKRKSPTNASNLINSRKRQKSREEKSGPAKDPPKPNKKPKPQKEKPRKEHTSDVPPKLPSKEARIVGIDDLKWSEVAVPDQLDDYEGFFGLEEVENIEVVRHADSGKVSFKAPDAPSMRGDESKLDTYAAVTRALKAAENGSVGVEEDEEWAGFSDAESVQKEETEKARTSGRLPDGENQNSAVKKSTAAKKASVSEHIGAIPFAGLLDEAADEGVDVTEWQPLSLSPETLSALSNMRFARPTPIQSAAIPEVMAGHDVVGKASTGSGKTLAFGIPILERFLLTPSSDGSTEKEDTNPLALVMAPTRELAHQIGKHLTTLCNREAFAGPRIAIVTGGLSIQKQQRQLATADIVIGTPGRLWEVMSGGKGIIQKLQKIEFLVIDEADRLLSEGHFKEVEEILSALDREDKTEEASARGEDEESQGKERQTLVFSATFHKGLQQKLSGKSRPSGDLMTKQESMEYLLKKLNFQEEKPKFIDVNPESQMASRLKEGLIECTGTEKVLIP